MAVLHGPLQRSVDDGTLPGAVGLDCAELVKHGMKLLNGPIDRSWARRTAAFAHPAGHVWEIAQVLPE